MSLSSLSAKVLVPAAEFFIGPDTDYTRETSLGPDEMLVEVQVPSGLRSLFLKSAVRQSIDFARGSVATVIVGGTGSVQQARIALGAVSATPRRATQAEAFLVGKALQAAVINQAADLAVQGARPLSGNVVKVELARGLVRSALTRMAA